MWSLESLSTLNALAAKIGPREAHRLFTSRLASDAERANRILSGESCDSCGDVCPVIVAKADNAEAA